MGVQLFFIASAYTLCLSASRRKNERHPLIKFGIRRYFRIAPAYYLGILLYFFISLIESQSTHGIFIIPEKYNAINIISNLTFVHGFFPPANNNIVPGGWSIGTEMAFYALFPALFYIADKKLKTPRDIGVFIFAGILCSQFVLFALKSNGYTVCKNNFLYFNLINQLPVFLIGIGYYVLKNKLKWDWSWKLSACCFLFFTLISLTAWYSKVSYLFSIIPVLSGISFIFLIEIFHRFSFLNHPLLIRIGQVSYSMYLFHFIFAQYITGYITTSYPHFGGTFFLIVFYLFSIFLTFGIALISEKYIEKPSIELGRLIIKQLDKRATHHKEPRATNWERMEQERLPGCSGYASGERATISEQPSFNTIISTAEPKATRMTDIKNRVR